MLVSCGGGSTAGAPVTVNATSVLAPLVSLPITARNGTTVQLRVEVAQTPSELNQGLSNRKSLDAEAGMLFVLPVRGPGFWMEDTYIPLSVAFISKCGDIVDIQDMQPLSEDLHSTQLDYRFGLEVNQGWFARHGVGVGDKVAMPPELRQAGC
jgi:uncharacterized membrane protein (UPF0127 family)